MAAVIWWTPDNINKSRGWIITDGPWIDLGTCHAGTVRYLSGGLSPVVEMRWNWEADRTVSAWFVAVDIPDYGTVIRRLNYAPTVTLGDRLTIIWSTEQ